MPAALVFVPLAPFVSVVNALAYLRARRAVGESLDLADFERAVLAPSQWQLDQRERVATLIGSTR